MPFNHLHVNIKEFKKEELRVPNLYNAQNVQQNIFIYDILINNKNSKKI